MLLALVGATATVADADEAAPATGEAEPVAPPVQEITPDEPVVPTPPKVEPVKETPAEAAPVAPAHTMDEVTVPRTRLRFGINFFGDASFEVTPDSPHTTFSLGALGIRLIGELSPSLDALAEFALETVPNVGPASDVEQLAIRWRHGPHTVAVGRFHTEIGYWNTAYHHGLWLQTPIERPHAVRFEDAGGIVPVHWVGVHYMLQLAAGPGNLTFVLGVGNGRGSIVDDVRVLGDTNDAKSVLLKVKYKAGGLELGVGANYDLIAPESIAVRPALPDARIHELLGNAYLAYRGEGVLAIAEGYGFRHIAGNQSWMTYAGYAVLGYAATPWLTPYVGLDTVHGADDDPFFTPDSMTEIRRDLVEVFGGLRFETSTWSALKLEFRFTKANGADNDYEGLANWSFGL